jgi:hypothetical protein
MLVLVRFDICDAIGARRLLTFTYAEVERIVEPHIYGVNTAGHEALSAWMRPGQSRTNPDGGWRMFLVDDMRDVRVLDDTFVGPRTDYNCNDPHFQRSFCRLPAGASDVEAPRGPELSGP